MKGSVLPHKESRLKGKTGEKKLNSGKKEKKGKDKKGGREDRKDREERNEDRREEKKERKSKKNHTSHTNHTLKLNAKLNSVNSVEPNLNRLNSVANSRAPFERTYSNHSVTSNFSLDEIGTELDEELLRGNGNKRDTIDSFIGQLRVFWTSIYYLKYLFISVMFCLLF